jgi:lipopolysaccharide biosynthesis protein
LIKSKGLNSCYILLYQALNQKTKFEQKKMEIKKIKQRKDGTKIVIVPRNSDLNVGDYVKIIKVEEVAI